MEFIGFIVILGVGSLVVGELMKALSQQPVIDAISQHSPWVAEHSQTLAITFGIILMLGVLLIPLVIKHKKPEAESNAMTAIGITVSVTAMVFSLGYLLSVGFIAAQTILGHKVM